MTIAALLMAAIIVSEGPRPAAVSVQGEQPTQFIAGTEGKTLYIYDVDQAGGTCSDDCLQAWPALPAKADDAGIGDWKPIRRNDAAYQWTYKDSPVYTFAADPAPGIATGDGSGGVWHALAYEGIPPAVVLPTSAAVKRRGEGFLLTDYKGQTLYTFAEDAFAENGQVPACTNACLEIWPPLRAPALAGVTGDWKPVDRADGVRQWAYRGRLVYTYSGDTGQNDMRGANAGGVWQVIPVSPDAKNTTAISATTTRTVTSQ